MPEGVGYGPQFTASTGLELNYIGSHVYGFSGTFQASNSPQTVINTSSGSGYIVGEFQLNAVVRSTDPAVGNPTLAQILFNGIIISIIKAEAGTEQTPSSETQKVIIPSYTNIQVIVDSDDNQADRFGTITFVGKVYK